MVEHRSKMIKRAAWTVGTFLCFGIAAYASLYFTGRLFRQRGDGAEHFFRLRHILLVHISGGILAITCGPWQFSERLRQSRPRYHRTLGYVYSFGVLIGGTFGLTIAVYSMGGIIAHFGFGALALLWLGTTARAVQLARRGQYAEHRQWMVRSFALTFAAVTLRIWLPLMVAGQIPFLSAYRTVSWLCWVPNLIVAEMYIRLAAIPSDARPLTMKAAR